MRYVSPFVKMLHEAFPHLRALDSRAIFLFSIHTRHGHYQIKVGPTHSPPECKEMGIPKYSRPIEITGELHHMFLSGYSVTLKPHTRQPPNNLRGAIIMKHVLLHFIDRHGQGDSHIPMVDSHIQPREKINLSGPNGDTKLEEIRQSGQLAHRVYSIIREDIFMYLKRLIIET